MAALRMWISHRERPRRLVADIQLVVMISFRGLRQHTVLLCGGDKKSQEQDIALAFEMVDQLEK